MNDNPAPPDFDSPEVQAASAWPTSAAMPWHCEILNGYIKHKAPCADYNQAAAEILAYALRCEHEKRAKAEEAVEQESQKFFNAADKCEDLTTQLAAAQKRIVELENAKPNHWLPKSMTVADIAAQAEKAQSDRDRFAAELTEKEEMICGLRGLDIQNERILTAAFKRIETLQCSSGVLICEIGDHKIRAAKSEAERDRLRTALEALDIFAREAVCPIDHNCAPDFVSGAYTGWGEARNKVADIIRDAVAALSP